MSVPKDGHRPTTPPEEIGAGNFAIFLRCGLGNHQFTRFAEADEIDEFHGVDDAPGQPEGQAPAEPASDTPDQDPPLPPADPPGGRLA